MRAIAGFAILIGLVAVACATGQWVEATIQLPDTFEGLIRPNRIEQNPATNILYVAEGNSDYIIGLDGGTYQKVSRINIPRGLNGMLCNPLRNTLYLSFENGDSILLVDCSQNRVVRAISSRLRLACYNQNLDKLYLDGDSLIVLDGQTDSVLTVLPVAGGLARLNPVTDKLYIFNHTYVTVIDCRADTVAGIIEWSWPVQSACCDYVHNKLFCTWPGEWPGWDDGYVHVIDGAVDTVMDNITVPTWPCELTFNAANGKVYCETWSSIVAIDGESDSLTSSTERAGGLWYGGIRCDPVINRIYDIDDYGRQILVIDGASDSAIAKIPIRGRTMYSLYADTIGHRCVVPIPDNGRVAFIDGSACRYDTSVYVGDNGPRASCYSAGNDRTYVGWGERAMVSIDGGTNRIVTSFTLPSAADRLCYVSKHNRLYCARSEYDTALAVVDCAWDSVVGLIPLAGAVSAMCYCQERDRLYCSQDDEFGLVVINCETESITARIAEVYGTSFCYNELTDKVYVSDYWNDYLCIVNAASDSVLASVEVGSCPSALCSDSSGRKVYCANAADCWCGEPSVAVVDALGDSLAKMIYLPDCPFALACRLPGNKVYCACGDDVLVIDGDADGVVKKIPIGAGFSGMEYDPAAGQLYCTVQPNRLVVVDCESDQVATELLVGKQPGPMAVNTRQGKLYVGNGGNTSISIVRSIPRPDRAPDPSLPTVVAGRQLLLPGSMPADLLDVSGRRVAQLLPGRNDIGSVPSGVYFLRVHRELLRRVVILQRRP